MRRRSSDARRLLRIPRCARRWPGLAGRITIDDMRRLNYAVDAEHRDPGVVVRDFLARLDANARLRDDQEMASQNSFQTRVPLRVGTDTFQIFSLPALERAGFPAFSRLPYLAEDPAREPAAPRRRPLREGRRHRGAGASGTSRATAQKEISFTPARVLLQDFTGVPAVVDLAAMRDGIVAARRRPEQGQSAAAGRARHRSLGAGRLLRPAPTPSS